MPVGALAEVAAPIVENAAKDVVKDAGEQAVGNAVTGNQPPPPGDNDSV